jgi:Glycosyl transferase family 2
VNCNYGRFLHDAIESALSQTYKHLQVVVVDDGSTDDSHKVIERFGDRVCAVFKSNGGQGSAMNAGFAASGGEVVIFLDADDVLSPSAAETVVAAMRAPVALIRYPLEVVDVAGNPVGGYAGAGGSRQPSALLGPFGVDAPSSGKAFSRKVLQKLMPLQEEEHTMCADAYLAALSSVVGEVVCLEEPLGKYRIHGSNNYTGTKTSVSATRTTIERALTLHASLRQLVGNQLASAEEWLSGYPQHWVARMESLRESPADHAWNDGFLDLTFRAVSASWRQPYWNFRRKLVYSVWVVAYALSPKRMARGLKRLEVNCGGGLASRLLGKSECSAGFLPARAERTSRSRSRV